jgi:predicted extracellular nuclease
MRFSSALTPLSVALGLSISLAACTPKGPPSAAQADGIAGVQGNAERSAQEGQNAMIEGVVTLAWPDGNGGGFVQSLSPDADPATSEGVFVIPAGGLSPLAVGQHIRAEGVVGESGQGAMLTTIANAQITLMGSAPLPDPLRLAEMPTSAAAWEALEGMRVRFDGPLTVTGNENLGRFGEVALVAGPRLFTPTEQVLPGEAAKERREQNAARRLVLDDGAPNENPGAVTWLPEPLSNAAPLRAGSTLSGVVGVVDHRFGGYRLQASHAVESVVHAARPEAPKVEGDVRIAGMNLLNLFNGDGRGGGFPTERGAQNAEAYQRQLAKHVATITALNPHLIAAQELENDGFGAESAIRELAKALNDAQPGARWQPVVTSEAPGTDSISVGLLYRADVLTTVGAPALLTNGPFAYGSRPPLAQTFRLGAGPLFTAVSVHFKSKGGCPEAEGKNRDQGDGQGCFNAQRVDSMAALADWLATDPTRSGSPLTVVLGDFNAYAMEDPMRLMRERGWQDPLNGEGSYSFVFDAQAGRLDHAMLSPELAALLKGAAKWHSNSDEALAFAYNGPLGQDKQATPWRSSDHDPMILGFQLGKAAEAAR